MSKLLDITNSSLLRPLCGEEVAELRQMDAALRERIAELEACLLIRLTLGYLAQIDQLAAALSAERDLRAEAVGLLRNAVVCWLDEWAQAGNKDARRAAKKIRAFLTRIDAEVKP